MSGAAALPLPFAGGAVHTATFVAAYALWAGSEMVLMRTRRAASSAVLERSSLRWLRLLLAAGVGSDFAVAALLPGASLGFAVPRVFWVGIALILAGLLLRWYAIAVLGRLFTVDVAVHADHAVVRSGPYRYVRHPAYSGMLLTLLGIGLALGNALGLLALLGLAGIGFGKRIAAEEAILAAALGEPYRRYMRDTSRLVPFVWRSPAVR